MKQFNNANDIGTWIVNNVPAKTMNKNQTIEETIIWFVSMTIADGMRDSYDRKDWAQTIQEGLPPVDLKSVDNWLEEQYNNCYEENEANEMIMDCLKEHFGV